MTPDEYCQQKAAASGSSFYYSFLFLPPERRRAITALYAFCREVDDVVDECSDEQVARITLASVRDAAIELGRAREVDGVFVSCTSLRTIDIVAEVEAAIGKPMISSNQAQAWHMLRLGKVDDRLEGYGRLFAC